MELLLSESRVKEWPGRAILATISCGHRQRGAGPRGSRCSCIVRVSGRCLRCSRVQTQCRFSCRFQRSSVQFGALHWQHCTAIRTWVRVAAGGGGMGVCVRSSTLLVAAGCWPLDGCSGRLRSRSSNGSALANREPSRISLVPIMQRGRDAANRLQPPCCCYCGKIP